MYSQYKKGKVAFVVAACVAVLAAAGVTVGILYFVNKPSSSPQGNAPSSEISSAGVIDAFQSTPPAALRNFPHQKITASDATVSVKRANVAYGISVQAEAAMIFSGSGTSQKADTETVLNESDTLFKGLGLEKTTTYPSGVSYGGKGLLCQIDLQSEPIFVASIACVGDSAITKAYQEIETLIALYNAQATETEKIHEPLQVSRTVLEHSGITGAILSVQYSENTKAGAFLFGAMNGQWQYVANLTGGVSTGKTNIPEAALPIIKDEKWKGVLTELTGVGQ